MARTACILRNLMTVDGARAGSSRTRATRQFQAVSDALESSSDFRSAQDIHSAIRSNGDKVGLATVYRALQTLVDMGKVDVLQSAGGEALYRSCSDRHHHHLVCRWCRTTVEVEGSAVEQWADRTARKHGFTGVDHTFELVGTCKDCAREGPGVRAAQA